MCKTGERKLFWLKSVETLNPYIHPTHTHTQIHTHHTHTHTHTHITSFTVVPPNCCGSLPAANGSLRAHCITCETHYFNFKMRELRPMER